MTTTISQPNEVLTIRRASQADHEALVRLAQLDSAPPLPHDDVLVAEVDGELLAATPVDAGRAIANPFRRTSGVVTLLESRRAELRADREPRRRWFFGGLSPSHAEG